MAVKKRKKMVHWVFDNGTVKVSEDSIQAETEQRFTFQLTRYKDSNTYEESLKIDCFLDGQDNGSIITDIFNLENDPKEFKRYGVVLSAIDFRDIRKVVEDNYLKLEHTPVSLENDSRLKDLLEMVKEYVQQSDYLVQDSLAYILVNDFNEIAADCGYFKYEMRTLRSKLADNEYIHKQGTRYAGIKRLRGKPERVIIFCADKLGLHDTEVEKAHE